MNIELKPIAEKKIEQLGGDVCGVLVRTDGGVMAVSEHGRCTRLDAGVMGPVDGAQGGEWLIQMRGQYLKTRGVWERPDHRGYTNDINEAGRYSEDEAKEAERMMPEKCKAVRLPTVRAQGGQGAEVVAWTWTSGGRHVTADKSYADQLRADGVNVQPLYTHPQPAVPEGWKLVPIASTSEMDIAAHDRGIMGVSRDEAEIIWNVMLDAAPQPPQEGE